MPPAATDDAMLDDDDTGDDPFVLFDEWHSESDEETYANL